VGLRLDELAEVAKAHEWRSLEIVRVVLMLAVQ
jgi:hypothetical protein